MTRNGIVKNLADSPYNMSTHGLVLFFSSLLHLKKFKAKYKEEIITTNISLSKRFKVTVNLPYLGILKTYYKIESRGFLIYDAGKGIWYNALWQVGLNGGNLIDQRLLNEYAFLTQKELES